MTALTDALSFNLCHAGGAKIEIGARFQDEGRESRKPYLFRDLERRDRCGLLPCQRLSAYSAAASLNFAGYLPEWI